MNIKSYTLLIAIVFLGTLFSCSSESAEDLTEPTATNTENEEENTNTSSITYTSDIQPLIASSCATTGCHNTNSNTSLDLTSYAEIKAAFQQTGASSAIGRIESGDMPRGAPMLSDTNINNLKTWINNDFIE